MLAVHITMSNPLFEAPDESHTWHWKEEYVAGAPGGLREAEGAWHPPPCRDVDCDLLIVGGGFAGLSAARHIAAALPALRIVVVEKHYTGFGASGRNTGYCNAQVMLNGCHTWVHIA